MIKSFIKSFITKPNIKLLMMILIIGILFIHPTFAAETTNTEYLTQVSEILNSIMKFCSRSRMILAIVAGKFMTNDMIYGSRLHLDQYLWQIWNVTKNFANFGLLGLMLYEIIQYITGKGKASIQGVIGKGLIAGILIQASRFLIGAVIDISTIATSAIASFPSTFIGSSTMQSQMETLVDTNMRNKTIAINEKLEMTKPEANTDNGSAEETKNIVARLMPNSDSVAGPLIFIGASALKIQGMMDLETDSTKDAKSIIVNFGLKAIILLLYVVTLLMLLVANVIRIGLLRVVIAISPILLLRAVFKDGKGFGKTFSISTILLTIFKPVIFTGMLSVILIFVLSIQGVMTGKDNININGVSISMNSGGTAGSTIEIEGISKATINDKIFTEIGATSASIFANIIIYFATLFLLWYLIKLAITSGDGPIEKAMGSMTNMAENFAKTVPIMNGYSRNVRSGATKNIVNQAGKNFGINLDMNKYNNDMGAFRNEGFENKFNNFMGGKNITNDEQSILRESATNESFIETTKKIYIETPRDVPFSIANDQNRQTMFQGWFNQYGKKHFNVKSREEFQSNTKAIKQLHTELGGDDGKTPKTYEEIKNIQYGKKE